MPDISMCNDKECPKFMDCYRAQATPSPHWQTYFSPWVEGEECKYFWPITEEKNA
jgi:hypothetical protein